MPVYTFSLTISSDDYLYYYQGKVHSVSVMSEQGKRLEFPAEKLRPFVSQRGIHGYFELVTDTANRFISLTRRL